MISKPQLKAVIGAEIMERIKQGYDVEALYNQLEAVGDSYDELLALSEQVAKAPMRADWPYVEPHSIEQIKAASDPNRNKGQLAGISTDEAARKTRAAFLASVCACMLGKPLEEAPFGTLWDIREAAQAVGEWPIKGYFSEKMLEAWGRRNPSWVETVRERIAHVAPDDDITYSICGMLLLEKKGVDFTYDDIRQLWIENLPIFSCWGPERTILLKAGIASLSPQIPSDIDAWPDSLNPGQEYCGALIRADAYGYASPGNPELAAELAWRDASFTHRKSGVYGTMFVAAAIAAAYVVKDPMQIFEIALQYVPQKSRFYANVSEALELVRTAGDFDEGYTRVHERFNEYGACRIFQELGTVINTLRFADGVEQGIGYQVAQGNDTDSFGCTCGSILGAFYGQMLPDRWIAPLQDTLHTTMGDFHETRLSAVTERMARLHLITRDK